MIQVNVGRFYGDVFGGALKCEQWWHQRGHEGALPSPCQRLAPHLLPLLLPLHLKEKWQKSANRQFFFLIFAPSDSHFATLILPPTHTHKFWCRHWMLVLYTCATRETHKKGCYLDWMQFSRIVIRGQNVPVFKKKGILFNSIRGI